MAFRGLHDADPSNPSVLVLQDKHRSCRYRANMYFIKYQLLLHIVGVIYILSIIKLISSLLVVPVGTPPSPADESLH